MNKFIAVIATLVLVTFGVGLIAIGNASGETQKITPPVCHPVNGAGELGNGWNLISPDQASSHIDELTGAAKHTSHDGRSDHYTYNGECPYVEDEPTETPTTETPDPEPTDYCETVDGVQDEEFNCPPAENPEKPVRSQQCVGNDLVVTVEYPNGNIEHYSNPGHELCATDTSTDDPAPHSVGSPKRLASAPEVEVVEEGM